MYKRPAAWWGSSAKCNIFNSLTWEIMCKAGDLKVPMLLQIESTMIQYKHLTVSYGSP